MKQLTLEHIREAENKTFGKPYPAFAHELKQLGVDKYEVNVKNHDRTFVFNINDHIFIPGYITDELQCSHTFELSEVVAAITRNKDKETDYSRFLEEIAHAGVHKYTADLVGMQLIYNGKKVTEVYAEPIPSV